MKRFWLVLLSLGLLVVFSASAFAQTTVRFSGSFHAGGMYLDKIAVRADAPGNVPPSTAFYFQRLRLNTEFVVAPGVSLITRADIMERAWGAARTTPGTALDGTSPSAGTTAENENIAFDYAFARFSTPIGMFSVGYMDDLTWGTVYGNSSTPTACISYVLPSGKLVFIGKYCKGNNGELSYTAKNPGTAATWATDRDNDNYLAAVIYNYKGGAAGFLGKYTRSATTRGTTVGQQSNSQSKYYILVPYAVATLGPVRVQAEVTYIWGKYAEKDSGFAGDISVNSLAGWLDATATFGKIYFGGTFAYVSGDNPDTTDKFEGGIATGGLDYNPCLLLWNNERSYWVGSMGAHGLGNASPMGSGAIVGAGGIVQMNPGAVFLQGRFGVRPTDKWDIQASLSYAYADRKPNNYVSDAYGWELDVTGTYRITTNLSYMIGVGYLWTGDYFKGTSSANNVRNNYIVLNKLTLTF